VLTGGPLVFAAGIAGGREGAEKAFATLDGARAADEARALTQTRSALLPWMMFEVDEPGEKWTQGLRDIVKRGEDVDRTRKPGSKSSTPVDPDGDHVDVKVGTLDPALKLPKDTLHLEVLLTPRTKGKHPTRKGHLFVVPRGAATWLGYSEDVAAIASRLRLAVDDTSEAGTLARSTDAATLRGHAAVGAGLVSPSSFAYLTAKTTTPADLHAAAKSAAHTSAALPRGPETITWSLGGDAAPGSVHVSLRGQITRPTAVDVLRMMGL
jgi:hypothetical protein